MRGRATNGTRFPHEAACLRLVTAIAMETSDEWLTERIYLDMSEE